MIKTFIIKAECAEHLTAVELFDRLIDIGLYSLTVEEVYTTTWD